MATRQQARAHSKENAMKTKLLVSALLLSAVAITPSHANFFSNPALGINLNVGSAPSPTPQDIREERKPIITEDVDQNNPTTVASQPAPAKSATTATNQKTPQPAAGNARTAQSSPSR
jgi:hypothetical protein